MRARGLKLGGIEADGAQSRSRPMRARGLKPPAVVLLLPLQKSRPMRARGLKRTYLRNSSCFSSRAPCGRVG